MKFPNLKSSESVPEAEDVTLTEFDKHKKELVDILRAGHERERGSMSEPFDEAGAWRRLSGLARSHIAKRNVRRATKPAYRIDRLRVIAKILRRSHRLVDRTMQTDIGDDLFSAWWEVTGSEHAKPDGTFDPRYMERVFKQLVKSLSVLENAASYGADHVERAKRGKPSVLTRDDIWNLAVVYRESTSSIPGAGEGPFADFVMKFLIATGRPDDIGYESLIEAIKDARRWALTHPVARKWGPSPFDEEG
jgi:hypothetical protein